MQSSHSICDYPTLCLSIHINRPNLLPSYMHNMTCHPNAHHCKHSEVPPPLPRHPSHLPCLSTPLTSPALAPLSPPLPWHPSNVQPLATWNRDLGLWISKERKSGQLAFFLVLAHFLWKESMLVETFKNFIPGNGMHSFFLILTYLHTALFNIDWLTLFDIDWLIDFFTWDIQLGPMHIGHY